MIDLRPVLFIIGIFTTTLAVAMCLPAVADAVIGNPDWQVFTLSAALSLFVGILLMLLTRSSTTRLSLRQAFLLVTISWTVLPLIAGLPFAFANLDLTYADAYFETVSGLTTTGSTVIVGLDRAPPGILLWRSLLQWLGGIGFIGMAVALLPMLRVGGMQLFRMESSDRSDKVLPRAGQIAGAIGLLYVALTALCALAYYGAGMNGFEAINHAMTTLSTGGYSTRDASIGGFQSPAIEVVGIVFMTIGGATFISMVRACLGSVRPLLADEQVQSYIFGLAAVIVGLALWRWTTADLPFLDTLRAAAFNVISVVTTTGYASTDYSTWGGAVVMLFFLLTFVGGCSGSTAGGLKVFRLMVAYRLGVKIMRQLLAPHAVLIARVQGKEIRPDVAVSVSSFLAWWFLIWAALSLALALTGLDLITSLSGAATAMANVGPGLGDIIGPAGNFATLPTTTKWLLSLGMVLGRLELMAVLILFLPAFWRY